jgi:hypothetical protein
LPRAPDRKRQLPGVAADASGRVPDTGVSHSLTTKEKQMFFDSWVLDWFAILNLATLALTFIIILVKELGFGK